MAYPGEVMKTVEDALGRKVQVPEEVERIVGLEAGALRIITYLEATDLVVGVETFEKRDRNRPYSLAHPELADLPGIGPIHGGDPELIVAAQPEVIFWAYATKKKANVLQSKTGISVYVLNPGPPSTMSKHELEASLSRLGRVIDKEERAAEVIRFIDREIERLRTLGKSAEKSEIEAYVGGIGHRGAHGIRSTEPSYQPFSFIELNNVAGSLGTDHATVNREKIIQWDPDFLFVDEAGLSLVKEDLRQPEFRSLSAIQSEKVFGVLPYNYYTTNFGTVLADTYYIGETVYPEAFGEINPKKEADRIYEFLVGSPVYSEMEEIFGGFEEIRIGD